MSALLQGKPRIGVYSFDLGLQIWLEGEIDRTVLTWCRGAIVMGALSDPKTALLDVEDCHDGLPEWLAAAGNDLLERCREEASKKPQEGSLRQAPAPVLRP